MLLTQDEHNRLARIARASDMTMSDVIRRVIAGIQRAPLRGSSMEVPWKFGADCGDSVEKPDNEN